MSPLGLCCHHSAAGRARQGLAEAANICLVKLVSVSNALWSSGATKDMGKMLGGEEEKDPDAAKKEEERQEMLRQQEEERKAKHARMEAEREKVRQTIRDKVESWPGPAPERRLTQLVTLLCLSPCPLSSMG